ncbi:flagellar protein FliS [Aureibacillus halotolerans]|uniref:Flagellar secretion chaperone FliS n=2 Tax=Aureibacillus halotolerans TaxID=1508390 RepID=A0A4R6TUA6_9BACI|nr:flagellar protein FliS [Aureibacillus halotolerans]
MFSTSLNIESTAEATMSIQNPYQAYQQNSVTTASPGELTLMLYNGCLKFIGQARNAIKNGEQARKNEALLKAQKIISELSVTLRGNDDLAGQMQSMYEYINHQLVQANTNNSEAALNEAEQYVTEFRDTWKEVLKSVRKQQFQKGGQA